MPAGSKDLQKKIAEFLRQIRRACFLNRVENFVGLLDEVRPQGQVSLLAVPGAAAGGTQSGLDGDQVFK